MTDSTARAHLARSGVIGLAAQIEDRIDLVLAAAHGRDVDAVWFLYTEAFPRVPVPTRMAMLKRLLGATPTPRRRTHARQLTFAEARPLLFPLIELVTRTRNVLAHAIAIPSSTDATNLTVRHRRQGRIEQETFSIEWLEALAEQSVPVMATLDDLLSCVADPDVWGALYGFNDRAAAPAGGTAG